MGFFKSIGKTFSRVATAVVTSGASEIARKVAPPVAPILQSLYAPTSLKQAVPVITSAVTLNPLPLVASVGSQLAAASMPQQPTGGQPMAFNVGQFLGGVQQAFGGSSNQYLSGIGQVAGLASSFVPVSGRMPTMPSSGGQVFTVASRANVPAVVPSSGLTKEIFDAGSKVLSRLGIPYRPTAGAFASALKRALGSIASLARRTPAGSIVGLLAGIGLTAVESNLLVAWQSQRRRHRRMNPANAKALRRAARRIKGFHKLCRHTDLIKTRRAPAYGRKCGSCRKNPCSC